MQSPFHESRLQKQQTIRRSSPRICKELPPSEVDPPTEEEICSFGKIIGIDPDSEPHLLYLAKEGLIQPLPSNWTPCHDPVRDVWYYFDTVTKKTQWEHPLNSVYKQKVKDARNLDKEMNTEQFKNKTTLKDFPPLRKNTVLAPLQMPPDPVEHLKSTKVFPPPNRLAPLKPIGKLQPIQGLPTAATPLGRVKAPLALEEGRKLVPPSWIPDEDPPSIGESGGMSLQKMSSDESVSAYGNLVEKPKIIKALPLGSLNSVQASPLGTLVGQPKPTLQSFPAQVKPVSLLKPPIKAKGNVKFNLEEEDIDLKFETSSRAASSDKNDESSNETSNDNESEELSDEEPIEPQKLTPVTFQRKDLTPVRTQPMKPPDPMSVSVPVVPKVVTVQSTGDQGAGDKDLEVQKKQEEALRVKMESELTIFCEKLAEEQRKRENEVKMALEASLQKLQIANNEKLAREKESIEKGFETEQRRLKTENGKRLAEEIEQMKLQFDKEVKTKREELVKENEQILRDVSSEINLLDRGSLLAAQKKAIFEQISLEVKLSAEEFRKKQLIEQDLEIGKLKASHQECLENLRKEWTTEETKVRQDQRRALDQLRHSFNEEQAKLLQSQAEIDSMKKSTNQRSSLPPPITPTLSAALEDKERELFRTKRKYKLLQHKFTALKDEISNFPPLPPEEPETLSMTEDSFNNSVESQQPITSDRLTRALGALEILREQILDMNPNNVDLLPVTSTRPEKSISTDRRPKPSPVSIASARPRKHVQAANVFPTKRLQQAEPVPDQYEAVREAKAFIKSQRHRLHLGETVSRSKVKDTETTESSGIGSLKRTSISNASSPRSPLNSKVAKDIDIILTSLKKLDSQMQSLWGMVGQGQGSTEVPQGFLTPLIHPTSPAALAQYNIMRDHGVINPNSWHPPITNAELRSRYTVTSSDPMTSAPVVPNSSLLNNLEYNQPSKHVLEDELQNFEALQERIWKTYGPPQVSEEEDSIKAKAKDLRDWLHKF